MGFDVLSKGHFDDGCSRTTSTQKFCEEELSFIVFVYLLFIVFDFVDSFLVIQKTIKLYSIKLYEAFPLKKRNKNKNSILLMFPPFFSFFSNYFLVYSNIRLLRTIICFINNKTLFSIESPYHPVSKKKTISNS